ncbi:MAG: polysaccharide deacetylase family protein [Pseudomonadota bacterium]
MADSVGPAVVATADRQLWAEAINTESGFDDASRAAQLIYARNLRAMQLMTDDEIMTSFKIKSVNRLSVDKWITKELSLTFNNYLLAAKKCVKSNWSCLLDVHSLQDFLAKMDVAVVNAPANHAARKENLENFTRTYIAEQMRLAALFPKVTSEIATFNDGEWTGAQLADKEFYLTFDDGPTRVSGTTDETLNMLKENKKSAAFFVLGINLKNRIHTTTSNDVKKLYASQCLALHGWEHQSHAKWEQWQESVIDSNKLVAEVAEKNLLPLFRPPYGQRKADSYSFFQAQHLKVALWNIDSQDWNKKVDANAVANRIVTLMLIKRHGVILFHDIHSKAITALPIVFNQFGNAVEWGDCQALKNL